MRRALSFVAACIGIMWFAGAEEASVFGGGGLNLQARNLSFTPYIVNPGWRGMGKTSPVLSSNAVGAATFSVDMPLLGGRFDGVLRTGIMPDGRLSAQWALVPTTNMWVEECSISTHLPVPLYAGGRVVVDGRSFALPQQKASPNTVFAGKASKLEFFDAGGGSTLTVMLPKSREMLIQDSRTFNCPWFELRMKMGRRHSPSTTNIVDLAIALPNGEPFTLNPPSRYVAEVSAKWRPVRKAAEILPGSAADFTAMRGDGGVPAGRHGYLVVKDGHFEFENLPGVRQRFYGVNLAYKACFPERDEAERLATMLAAYGYNSVRLHHFDDGGLVGEDGTTPIEGRLRQLDALIDACVRHGLYLTTDLLCLRKVPKRLVGIDEPGSVADYKWMVFFHDGVFSNHVQFVTSLLNHRNIYTGRRYAEEPALTLISLVNEGLLTHRKTPAAGSMAYRITSPIWRKWIADRQRQGTFKDVSHEYPASASQKGTNSLAVALQTFCAWHEDRFASRMRRLVREELGCKALLTSLNAGVPPAAYDGLRKRNFDYSDTHYYWDHPRFLGHAWCLPTEADHYCANPVCTPYLGRHVRNERFHGQPWTVTEVSFCPPGRYRSMYGLVTGGNAAFDDWGGAWRFCWGCEKGGVGMSSNQTVGWFAVAGDVTALAAERAIAALFLRGDLAVGTGKYGEGESFAIERFSGAVTVNTPRTAGGFRERGRMEAGALVADFGHVAGAVWATSLTMDPIVRSRRILLSHLTDGVDSGTVFRDGRRTIIEKWGREPHLLRAGRVDVSLRLADCTWTVFALDATGARRQRVDAHYFNGWLKFTADVSMRPDDATFLYEIVSDNKSLAVAPSYWCTWDAQRATLGGNVKAGKILFDGDQGTPGQRDNLNERILFGKDGWATWWPNVRTNLYLMLDDGWDVPYGSRNKADGVARFGACVPDAARFPSLCGTPGERLRQLNDRIKTCGWRGAALWVACQTPGETWRKDGMIPLEKSRAAWAERMKISREAGIDYWKVDWGAHSSDGAYRAMMAEVRDAVHPGLMLEHCRCTSPLNGVRFGRDGSAVGVGRLIGNRDWEALRESNLCILSASDVFRTYDYLDPFGSATTLERCAYYSTLAESRRLPVVLNVEGNVLIAAALGHTFGSMRLPDPRNRPCDVDIAAAWQRIAPPFGHDTPLATRYSEETACDRWTFTRGSTWYGAVDGKTVSQTAPVAVVRGMPLPDVSCSGEKPFVCGARFPNGARALAFLPRVVDGRRNVVCPADVRLDLSLSDGGPFAVFGRFNTLAFSKGVAKGSRILARCLPDRLERDVTSLCKVDRNGSLFVPASVLFSGGSYVDHAVLVASAPGSR